MGSGVDVEEVEAASRGVEAITGIRPLSAAG